MSDWIRDPSVVHPGWKTAIELKQELGLTNDADPEDLCGPAARRAYEILEHWRQSDVPARFSIDTDELESLADQFHTLGYVDARPAVHEFDLIMDALYDWADEERVLIR